MTFLLSPHGWAWVIWKQRSADFPGEKAICNCFKFQSNEMEYPPQGLCQHKTSNELCSSEHWASYSENSKSFVFVFSKAFLWLYWGCFMHFHAGKTESLKFLKLPTVTMKCYTLRFRSLWDTIFLTFQMKFIYSITHLAYS